MVPVQPGSARSSTASHDDVQYPLHALLQPSMENIEAFLADEMKEMEHEAAQHLLTLSQSKPSPASDSSSSEQERRRQDEELDQLEKEQEENEDEDYWKSYYEQPY